MDNALTPTGALSTEQAVVPAAETTPLATDLEPKQRQKVALALLLVALAIPAGLVAWRAWSKAPLPCSQGGAVALMAILFGIALIVAFPALIMDDAPDAGGGASTMRILCIAIIFTFCAIELRAAWNQGIVPSLQDQGNWVWLVTAALGGKALQKFAEIKQ